MIGDADDLVWHEAFQFPADRGMAESVALREALPTDEGVHALGCAKERRDGEEARARGRSGPIYRGCIDAVVGDIRSKTTKRGHRFDVTHVPQEGVWHGHVAVDLAAGIAKLNKNDKDDVRELIAQAFGPLKPHACT